MSHWIRPRTACAVAALIAVWIAWPGRVGPASAADTTAAGLESSFEQAVRPVLQSRCILCHSGDTAMAGVRLDELDAKLAREDLRVWELVQTRVDDATMPPEGAPQPTDAERRQTLEWIRQALDFARMRPVPKNGAVRRLTVAQYRNTLRELLLLDEDVTDVLPPDAVSEDGFVNNAETLQLSPLLMEAYLEVAEEALERSMVDPGSTPKIQNFRVNLGRSVNPAPLREELILGANSQLLDIRHYAVTQLVPDKPFAFEPIRMRTKYRFNEGYRGNATVRGWRDYDSIYHAVFAGMRGSKGYPKGNPFDIVPEGLLLRPAIPTDEIFRSEGTFGPKANFKISTRELPDDGRFRVTVIAAKYEDGLLLEKGVSARKGLQPDAVVTLDPSKPRTVTIGRDGIYQVDIYDAQPDAPRSPADPSRLGEGLVGAWPLDRDGAGRLEGDARFVNSPFGRAVTLDGNGDSVVVPRTASMGVGNGDFTVAAWIRPRQLRKAGIVALGRYNWQHGWYLDMPNNRGELRIETAGPDNESNGAVTSPSGVIRSNAWQHVAAVVRRGENATQLYVNGYEVAKGRIGPEDLDNPQMDIHLGRIPDANQFRGDLDDVRIYRRALNDSEIQALVQPGERFAEPPGDRRVDLTLALGDREFSGTLLQPAFLAVRLTAGPLQVVTRQAGIRKLTRIVLTPLVPEDPVARRFLAFEKRSPRVGVHLGLRRDCGHTFSRVNELQPVHSTQLSPFVFEAAIRDFPSPDVEDDNVNYLAGIREIAVRSEYTDGRDMPRLLVHSVEFEGPLYETWPPASHRNIFGESDNSLSMEANAREIIRRFANRAYRRPVSPAEEDVLVAVYDKALASGKSFHEGVKDALLVALTSPQFLFLVENSETPEPEPLTNHELASKLGYFLWNGPPDSVTLQLADSGVLRERLDAEVKRMVKDPRFSRFAEEFVSQWLDLGRFDVLEPDREQFPKLTRETRFQLRREPVEFLQYMIRNNLPLRNLIDSDFVVANEVVASYYDLADRVESGFRFVPVRHEQAGLGGVLTQAAIMAGLSDGRESNPVKRGTWLARRIVAEPPDPPPPNVPDLSAETEGLSLRERLAQHRSQPGCVQCHLKIDPWGVPFEEYDAGGRLKQAAVDARSELPDGTRVEGVSDLKRYLAEDRIDQVAFSVLKHLATYANGRSLEYSELHYLKQDGMRLGTGGYRMGDMIRYIVDSELFLEK